MKLLIIRVREFAIHSQQIIAQRTSS
jgi:hypothetical protein